MSEQMEFPDPNEKDDICRNRHKGNEFSEAAAPTKKKMNERMEAAMILIRARGAEGLTTDELAVAWGITPNRCSSVMTKLKAAGMIQLVGRRLTRCPPSTAGVWVAVEGRV